MCAKLDNILKDLLVIIDKYDMGIWSESEDNMVLHYKDTNGLAQNLSIGHCICKDHLVARIRACGEAG